MTSSKAKAELTALPPGIPASVEKQDGTLYLVTRYYPRIEQIVLNHSPKLRMPVKLFHDRIKSGYYKIVDDREVSIFKCITVPCYTKIKALVEDIDNGIHVRVRYGCTPWSMDPVKGGTHYVEAVDANVTVRDGWVVGVRANPFSKGHAPTQK